MVRTIEYKPSDLEAVKIVQQIKKELGIDGKIDSPEEIRKVDAFLRSKGWDMSMTGCNPAIVGGANAYRKALCILFNEMREAQTMESKKMAEQELKQFGEMYRPNYERTLKRVEQRRKSLEEYNNYYDKLLNYATGKHVEGDIVPDKKKEIHQIPRARPLKRNQRITTTTKAEPTKNKTKWVIVGGVVLAGVGWYILTH